MKPDPKVKGGTGGADSQALSRRVQSEPSLPDENASGKHEFDPIADRQTRLDELARDPAHNFKVSDKSIQEAEVGLSCEEAGKIPGPIRRDPTGAAEFIDGAGQAWDVKGFNSSFPPEKGGFELAKDFGKVQDEIEGGDNVIIDTSKMSSADVASLSGAVNDAGLSGKVVWYP